VTIEPQSQDGGLDGLRTESAGRQREAFNDARDAPLTQDPFDQAVPVPVQPRPGSSMASSVMRKQFEVSEGTELSWSLASGTGIESSVSQEGPIRRTPRYLQPTVASARHAPMASWIDSTEAKTQGIVAQHSYRDRSGVRIR